MSSDQFVANWPTGDNSFADNPPMLSCRSRSRAQACEDAVVVIQDPHLDEDTLTYTINLLDGSVPAATRTLCAVHRPLLASLVTGLRSRDAPA